MVYSLIDEKIGETVDLKNVVLLFPRDGRTRRVLTVFKPPLCSLRGSPSDDETKGKQTWGRQLKRVDQNFVHQNRKFPEFFLQEIAEVSTAGNEHHVLLVGLRPSLSWSVSSAPHRADYIVKSSVARPTATRCARCTPSLCGRKPINKSTAENAGFFGFNSFRVHIQIAISCRGFAPICSWLTPLPWLLHSSRGRA
jgi:hypothetical protein